MRFEDLVDRFTKRRLTAEEAGQLLGMSGRQFRRLHSRYAQEGAEGPKDRRLGKPSPRRADAGKPARGGTRPIAGNDSVAPITLETRSRVLLAISRDPALEPLDIRVAIELIDKLAAGTRTRLDLDTLTTNVSASAIGVRNALEQLMTSGYIAVTGSWRGYAGHGYALMLGATAMAHGT